MRFGVIGCTSPNLGDDVQTLAALQYMPRAKTLDRDALSDVTSWFGPFRTIMNGWFMYEPGNWPPSASIDPLLISFHLSARVVRRNKSGISPSSRLLQGENLEWFQAITSKRKIGTRDRSTLRAFHEAGVDAELSGCLTLTLKLPRSEGSDIVAVIEDPEALDCLKNSLKDPVVVARHTIRSDTPLWKRHRKARSRLELYANARSVVTDRLHVALPCLAAGTPVLLVHPNLDDPRFDGLVEHLHSVSLPDFIAGRHDYNLEALPANPDTWRPMADALAARCTKFVSPGS